MCDSKKVEEDTSNFPYVSVDQIHSTANGFCFFFSFTHSFYNNVSLALFEDGLAWLRLTLKYWMLYTYNASKSLPKSIEMTSPADFELNEPLNIVLWMVVTLSALFISTEGAPTVRSEDMDCATARCTVLRREKVKMNGSALWWGWYSSRLWNFRTEFWDNFVIHPYRQT